MNYQSQNCRVCLKDVKTFYKLTEKLNVGETEISYETAFVECTGFAIEPFEPQQICETCASELRNAFNFREKCKKTQDELGNCFKIEEVQIKTELLYQSEDDGLINYPEDEFDDSNLGNQPSTSYDGHSNTERYQCNLCTCSYTRRSDLKNHYNKKHQDQDLFKCPQCDLVTFEQILNLHLQHMHKVELHSDQAIKRIKVQDDERSKILKTEERYICDLCEISYKRRKHLKIHYDRKHADQEKLDCPQCSVKFYSQLLKLHLHFKHKLQPEPEPPIVVNEPINELTIQQNTEMETSDRFKCDLCERSYKRREHLKDIYKSKHADEEIIKCPLCEMKSYLQIVKLHMKHMHKVNPESEDYEFLAYESDEVQIIEEPLGGSILTPFVEIYYCDLCGKPYKRREHLRDHYKAKHADEELHQCPYCHTRHYLQMLELHLIHKHKMKS